VTKNSHLQVIQMLFGNVAADEPHISVFGKAKKNDFA
jgi:hypothetical protein